MSLEQIEAKLLALPGSERRQFLHWVDDHRHEILPGEDEICDDMQREILRRSADLQASPGLAEPVDNEYFERIKRKVADPLARKASAV